MPDARTFASTEYLTELFAGDSLSPDEAKVVAANLSRYTGLSSECIQRSNLRVSTQRYLKELLRNRGKVMAIHDTRFTGVDPDEAGETVAFGPFMTSTAGPFVAGINTYLADELEVDKDRITLRNYFGGHMMYLHDPSLEALVSDIGAFIENR